MKECYGLAYEFNEDVPILNATGVKLNYYSLNHIAHDFGYRPTINSIDSIVNESRTLLQLGIPDQRDLPFRPIVTDDSPENPTFDR
jgi:hypothetical protein